MIDLAISLELQSRFQAQFPDCYVGTPISKETITLPAILIDLTSQTVLGSPLQVGDLTIHVQSSSEDSDYESHMLLSAEVDDFMRAQTFDEGGAKLWPPVAKSSAQNAIEQRWTTSIGYTVGMEKTA